LAAEAEARLEDELQKDGGKGECDELRSKLEAMTKERDELQKRIEDMSTLDESYSDLLAMARTFVSKAENSGIKPKHVRKSNRKVS
jgi:phage shock protein A